MPAEPYVKPLERKHRARFFWLTFFVFFTALPLVVFYAVGYRFDFFNDSTPGIVTTGGMYISVDDDAATIYVDEEPVNDARIFRSASYVQSLPEGMHRVHVQRFGGYTWVKELPVHSQIVIEAAAFTMSETPQLRPITEYVSATGTPVFFSDAASSTYFANATATVAYDIATSTVARRGLVLNDEYTFLEALFSATSTQNTETLLERWRASLEQLQQFGFASTTIGALPATTSTTTPPLHQNNTELREHDGELFARWVGDVRSVPYYFCIVDYNASTTAAEYGEHVALAYEDYALSTTTPLIYDGNRTCRREIRLDRQWQDVKYYNFFPGDSDLVLLQLEDGLYVTEIDDRAWQNSQRLYAGTDFETIVENNTIYIKTDDVFFVLTPRVIEE